jgi:hypothetical protein
MISLAQLKMAWKRYPKEYHPKLMSLLEKFEVAFQMKQKDVMCIQLTYFLIAYNVPVIPSFLTDTKPVHLSEAWKSESGVYHRIGRTYEFTFVPLGFCSRMITRVIHQFKQQFETIANVERIFLLISNFLLTCVDMWRNGIHIKFSMADQEIVLDYSTNSELHRLDIISQWKTNAPLPSIIQAERLFMTLIQAIETLLENYYATEIVQEDSQWDPVKRWISCAHCLNSGVKDLTKAYRFAYPDCVNAITAGTSTMTCGTSQKAVRIDFMAPDLAFSGIPIIQPEDLQIGQQIGSGGFGVVYKGTLFDRATGKSLEVAVKELHLHGEEDQLEKFEEFKREAFIMSSLKHQNLVNLYGITVSPKLSMVMEFVRGGDLHHKFHVSDTKLDDMRAELKEARSKHEEEVKAFFSNLSNYGEQEKQSKFQEFDARKKELDAAQESLVNSQRELDDKMISWRLRYKVSLDIAKGIRHLHSIVPPVVHRDLRSPNVFVR